MLKALKHRFLLTYVWGILFFTQILWGAEEICVCCIQSLFKKCNRRIAKTSFLDNSDFFWSRKKKVKVLLLRINCQVAKYHEWLEKKYEWTMLLRRIHCSELVPSCSMTTKKKCLSECDQINIYDGRVATSSISLACITFSESWEMITLAD